MARIGVNYYDVSKAADAIRKKGEEPTIDRVREYLGTGSKSTIAPLLKRWRSLQTEDTDPDALPEELLDSVRSLHLCLQQKADEKINEYRKKFESAEAQTIARLDEAEKALNLISIEKANLETRNSELDAALSTSQNQLEQTRVKLATTEANREDANNQIEQLKNNLKELKQDNRIVRDHFEHYQERIAEDRLAEREQHRLALASAQEQIRQLQITLSQTEYKQTHLQSKLESLKESYTTLEKVSSSVEAELKTKEKDNLKLSKELNTLNLQYTKLAEDNQRLREETVGITATLAATDKEFSILNLRLATASEELALCRIQVEELTQENKQTLLEKALLQGKFDQLQESI